MPSRRSCIAATAAGAALLSVPGRLAFAWAAPGSVKGATAMTEVLGDGLKLVAVAVEYERPIDGSKLSRSSFHVEGRTVTDVHASVFPVAERTRAGGLLCRRHASCRRRSGRLQNGPTHFGPRQIFRPATATVFQAGTVVATDGQT